MGADGTGFAALIGERRGIRACNAWVAGGVGRGDGAALVDAAPWVAGDADRVTAALVNAARGRLVLWAAVMAGH